MNCSTPGLPVDHQLPEFTQIHVHRVGDAIQPSHPLLSPSPPAPTPPSIRVFSDESTLRIRWPKYWSFSFSISPSNERPGLISFTVLHIRWPKHWSFSFIISPSSDYSGLISFRIDSFDLPAVQGTLKSLLQHHSSKESIL